MAANKEVQLLEKIRVYFEDQFGDASLLITDLGELVQMTSLMMTNENMWEFCVELSQNKQIWNLLEAIMTKLTGKVQTYTLDELRLLKGIVLVTRNLLITHERLSEERHHTLRDYTFLLKYFGLAGRLGKSMIRVFTNNKDDEKRLKNLDISIVCFHCMFNILQTLSEEKKKDFIEIRSTLELLNGILVQMNSVGGLFEIKQVFPQFKAFCMLSESRDLITENDCLMFKNLLAALTRSLQFSVNTDIQNLKETSEDKYNLLLMLVHTLAYMFHDEKIGGTMFRLEKESFPQFDRMDVLLFLVASQMTFSISPSELESKWDWDNVAIGSMCLDFFHLYEKRCTALLDSKSWDSEGDRELTVVHRKMIAVLDIISSRLPYELFRKTLNSYNFIQEIISFLQVVESNTERKRLKDSQKLSINKKKFPHAKTIIIEIITYLVHGDFQNQETVRKCGGLQLILNNCNLDVNEPFIRERCILCLKYLLENNQENQSFVASLEAQRIDINEENEKVLEKCGYEMDIVDGKVQLKRQPNLENSPTNGEKIEEV